MKQEYKCEGRDDRPAGWCGNGCILITTDKFQACFPEKCPKYGIFVRWVETKKLGAPGSEK